MLIFVEFMNNVLNVYMLDGNCQLFFQLLFNIATTSNNIMNMKPSILLVRTTGKDAYQYFLRLEIKDAAKTNLW